MKKKSITLLLTGAVLTAALTGCGANGSNAGAAASDSGASADTENAETPADTDNAPDADTAEAASGSSYKVGIVQYVDDASLNQIVAAIQTELDKKSEELGISFDYKNYTYNGQADATTMNQIATDLIASDVDLIIPVATPFAMVMQSPILWAQGLWHPWTHRVPTLQALRTP